MKRKGKKKFEQDSCEVGGTFVRISKLNNWWEMWWNIQNFPGTSKWVQTNASKQGFHIQEIQIVREYIKFHLLQN